MGALDTILTVANIGISAANYGKLQQMRQHQETAATVEALLQLARDMIFSAKQAADRAYGLKASNPKLATAQLRLIRMGIDEMAISPQMFPALKDKEYVADTLRAIQERQEEIEGDLTPEDKAEVQEAIDAMAKLGDLEYYVDKAPGARTYEAAKQTVRELKERNGCLINAVIIYASLTVLLLSLGGILMSSVTGEGGITLLSLIGLLLSIATPIWIRKSWQRADEYKHAKKIVDDAEIDLDRFHQIERKYDIASLADGRRQYQFTKIQVENFFGADGPAQLTVAEG